MKSESGDCAKQREALKRIVAASIVAKNANAPEWILQRMADIFATATAALAEPVRNCDRPECGTTKAAQDVWRKEDGGKTAYYEWLLAPATEQKGENDGNK